MNAIAAQPVPPLFRGWVVRIGPYSWRIVPRVLFVTVTISAALAALSFATLMYGTLDLSLGEVWRALHGEGAPAAVRSVQNRRLPRLITAIGVGGSLGVAGAVFQTLSRNVLGSPDIIGFTTGAATAAVVQIVFFGGGVLQTAGAAVLGGMLTALLVYALARKDGVSGGLRLVLVGIGVGAMLSAVMSFLVVRA
ncbi:FecCD family ABC transporter permease, partial [Rhodococcus erythropolis]